MKIPELEDGEWVVPRRKGWTHECCDCGLRHTVKFKLRPTVIGNQIMMSWSRLNKKHD